MMKLCSGSLLTGEQHTQVSVAIPGCGGKCLKVYAYSYYLALSYIHPPILGSSSTIF